MFSRKTTKKADSLAWYRSPKYKGDFTEEEKRVLDSFRVREERDEQKHPAAGFEELPHEVTMYISRLEVDLINKVQDASLKAHMVISAIGVFLILSYFGWISIQYNSTETLFIGGFLLVIPLMYGPIKFQRNIDQFWYDTDQEIRREWELEYILNKRRAENATGREGP